MIGHTKYINHLIKTYTDEIGIDRDEAFNIQILKDELEEDIKKFSNQIEKRIQKMSQEILSPLNIKFKIDNRRVNQKVDSSITPIDFELQKNDFFSFTELKGIEEIEGLQWDKKEQKIIGKANKEGDYLLTVFGFFSSSKGYQQKIQSDITLTIIPDPRTLWKSIEPENTLPFPKSHEDSMSLRTENDIRLLFASKRGRSHAHIGSFRDDDGKIITGSSGWSILGLADGAGSCTLSREGSRIAVNTAVDILFELLSSKDGDELEELFLKNRKHPSKELDDKINNKLEKTIVTGAYHALLKIDETAQSLKKNRKDFSTTLLLTAHKKLKEGHLIISFWVGDGVIGIYKQGQSVHILGEPDSGEFAGQTYFLSNDIFSTKESIRKRISIQLVEDFTAIVLATDGISDSFFNTDEALKNFNEWDKFWNPISEIVNEKILKESEKNLLSWLDFWSVGNHDDRSIALLLSVIKGEKDINV
jgi:serine/threonine protein phosphatase PrpC